MKRSLFKRVVAVSILVLSSNQCISCYTKCDKDAGSRQAFEQKVPRISVQTGMNMLDLLHRLSELRKRFAPFHYKTTVLYCGHNWEQRMDLLSEGNKEALITNMNGYIRKYGEYEFKRAINDFNTIFTIEWVNSFKRYLDQAFFEELQSIIITVNQIYQMYKNFDKSKLLEEALNWLVNARRTALSILNYQYTDSLPSLEKIKSIGAIDGFMCNCANILVCIVRQNGISV